jgi:hypothetical protein
MCHGLEGQYNNSKRFIKRKNNEECERKKAIIEI